MNNTERNYKEEFDYLTVKVEKLEKELAWYHSLIAKIIREYGDIKVTKDGVEIQGLKK